MVFESADLADRLRKVSALLGIAEQMLAAGDSYGNPISDAALFILSEARSEMAKITPMAQIGEANDNRRRAG